MADEQQDELCSFFSLYCSFEYDPQEASGAAYNRLVETRGWEHNSKNERKARKKFQKALVGQFEQLFGCDDNKLDVMQLLCSKIGVSPIPSTVTSCKKAIEKVHVNIVDFIDSERTRHPVPTFKNFKKFKAYTLENDKIFPKKKAKSNALLRFLLRPVF